MSPILLYAVIGLAVMPLAFAAYLTKLLLCRPRMAGQEEIDWLDSFQADRYRPLAQLFSSEDLKWFQSQPGYCNTLERKLTRERKQIIRSYLVNLTADFDRLLRLGQMRMLVSEADDEFFRFLFWQEVRFRLTIQVIRIASFLDLFGFRPIRTVSGLLDQFETFATRTIEGLVSVAAA